MAKFIVPEKDDKPEHNICPSCGKPEPSGGLCDDCCNDLSDLEIFDDLEDEL